MSLILTDVDQLAKTIPDYSIKQHLGTGSSCEVFHVIQKTTGQSYAVKVIHVKTEKDKQNVLREIEINKSLHHDNIIKYFDCIYSEDVLTNCQQNTNNKDSTSSKEELVSSHPAMNHHDDNAQNKNRANVDDRNCNDGKQPPLFNSKDNLDKINQTQQTPKTKEPADDKESLQKFVVIIMEYARNGNLLYLMNSRYQKIGKKILIQNNVNIKKIFQQVVSAVSYLHNNVHVVHRDLKPENILLDEQYNAKLIDFGMSKRIDNTLMQTRCGSPCYVAPEVITMNSNGNVGTNHYNEKSDVWSLGILLYFLATKKLPFYDFNFQTLFNKIVNDPIGNDEEFISLQPELKDLICKMLNKSPEERISAAEVLLHPFMENDTIACHSSVSLPIIKQGMDMKRRASRSSVIEPKVTKWLSASNAKTLQMSKIHALNPGRLKRSPFQLGKSEAKSTGKHIVFNVA
ncbi:hypothetical protein TRFO_29547 [Tritrichomonas foetus]|uniref:non-specific serine/threonine protein kinase n=1 Tax=Tritrichomonas foetus TaxID=1144522 RepID=A0A1J4JWP6_9EUKA|nr:hypothetical protein TRFO_29547 [Tritrichomonas foetus]|eukprot:OHT03090.1 hypothetical protein TRFO_29547 [Tritrichomonas foetus]